MICGAIGDEVLSCALPNLHPYEFNETLSLANCEALPLVPTKFGSQEPVFGTQDESFSNLIVPYHPTSDDCSSAPNPCASGSYDYGEQGPCSRHE
jgi:hypothetical protein